MLYAHDEGKNIRQLCDGETDAVCMEMGGTGAETKEGAQENLEIVSKTLLWENASPTSEFAEQTLQIDLSEYDEVEIVTRHNQTSANRGMYKCRVGDSIRIAEITNSMSETVYLGAVVRNFTVNKDGINVTGTYYRNTNTLPIVLGTTFLIPLAIYGIKGVQ